MAARMSKDRLAELEAMIDAGMSFKAISKAEGVRMETLRKYFNGRQALERRGNPISPERKARIEAMLDDGMSFAEIRRTEGVRYDTMQRYFPGRAWTAEQKGEFLSALNHFNNAAPKAAYALPARHRTLTIAA